MFLIREGMSLNKRVTTPPVWIKELSRRDILHEGLTVLVGDGWFMSLLWVEKL